MQNLSNHVSHKYAVAVAQELSTACADIQLATTKNALQRPDVLVLAPRCSDDPDFLVKLEHQCVTHNDKVAAMVKSGQIRFGGVGEWTGSDCPLVVLTGFHQPYHLLNNVGCTGPERILSASKSEVSRAKILAEAAEYNAKIGFYLIKNLSLIHISEPTRPY